jgi:hypothetical protein
MAQSSAERKSLDNLIYDQLTSSALAESAVSAAMLPMTGAATLAEARRLMGIDDWVQSALSS